MTRRTILRAPKRVKATQATEKPMGLFAIGSLSIGAERIAEVMRAMTSKGDDE